MLHCLVQTKVGGGSLLADGFYAANELKKQNKKYFNILSKTYVNWRDEGEEDNYFFNKKHRLPVIGYAILLQVTKKVIEIVNKWK